MAKRKKEDSLPPVAELASSVASGLKQVARYPNLLQYQPHEKQQLFHASQKKGRLYIGGNRSGKTTGGVAEDLFWLRGNHPNRRVPEPPVAGRVVTVDFKNGLDKIILPEFKRWVYPSLLINGSWEDSYDSTKRILTLANDSWVEFMSYEQDLDKFAGTNRDFIHFDEEPPKSIFGECKARLVDRGGSWWITMTPVDGITWVYNELYVPASEKFDPLIDVIEVNMWDNPHLSNEAIEDLLSGLDPEERRFRGTGEFVPIGGLIFDKFDFNNHVIDPLEAIPKNGALYASMDHGYNNPTAWLWHIVLPDGTIITFKEWYRSQVTISNHAERVKEIEKAIGMGEPILRVGDPAITQRSPVNGLSVQMIYSIEGVNIVFRKLDFKSGVDKVNTYLEQNKWYVTSDCVNLLKEIRTYRWKPYDSPKNRDKNNKREEPMKKDDHACDSVRYLFSFMPDLQPMQVSKKQRLLTKDDLAAMMKAGTTFDPRQIYDVDHNLTAPSSKNPWNQPIDSVLGGIY